jgi:hypothetical protein
MTGTTTALSGFAYGNGTYVASASSTFINDASVAAHKAFDRTAGAWLSGGMDMAARYENLGPLVLGGYIGSASTTVAGVVHAGEWLQLQLPTAVFADELHLMKGDSTGGFPGSIVVAGSNDGATWSLLSSHLDMPPWPADKQLMTGSNTAYTHIRLIVLKMYDNTQARIRDVRIIEYERPVLQAQLVEVQTDIATLQQCRVLFHQMQQMSRLLAHKCYSAPVPLSSFNPGMTRRWTLPYAGVPRDIRVLVLLNDIVCFASKSDVQIVVRGSMNDVPQCRYVRVSNASNTSSGLAFAYVSAFHAGTGEDLARSKAVTASPMFAEPGIATDTNRPHEGNIVLANGGAPLFWELDLGDNVPVGGLSFGGVPGYNEGAEIQLLEEGTRNVLWSSAVAGAISGWSPQIASALPWAIEYTHGPTITLHDVDARP